MNTPTELTDSPATTVSGPMVPVQPALKRHETEAIHAMMAVTDVSGMPASSSTGGAARVQVPMDEISPRSASHMSSAPSVSGITTRARTALLRRQLQEAEEAEAAESAALDGMAFIDGENGRLVMNGQGQWVEPGPEVFVIGSPPLSPANVLTQPVFVLDAQQHALQRQTLFAQQQLSQQHSMNQQQIEQRRVRHATASTNRV